MKRKFLKCMLLLAICSIFMSACSKPTKESIQTVSKDASQGENTSSTAILLSSLHKFWAAMGIMRDYVTEGAANVQGYSTQFSTTKPGTRSNSRTLFVTRIISSDLACAAIIISSGPIGVPLSCR